MSASRKPVSKRSSRSPKRMARPARRRVPVVSGPFHVVVEMTLSAANLVGEDGPLRLDLPRGDGAPEREPFVLPPILTVAANAIRLATRGLTKEQSDALEDAYAGIRDNPYLLRRRLCRLLLTRVRDMTIPLQQREAALTALTSLAGANDDTGAEELFTLDMAALRVEGFDGCLLEMADAARSDEPHPTYGDPADDRDAFARMLERSLERTRTRDPQEVSLGSADAILDLSARTLFVRGVATAIPLGAARGRIDDLRILMERRQRDPERGWVAVLAEKTTSRPSISRAGLWKLKEWLDELASEPLSKRLLSAQQSRRVRFNVSALVRC